MCPRLKKARYVRFNDDGMLLQRHPFRRERVFDWKDVSGISIDKVHTVTVKTNVVVTIDLLDSIKRHKYPRHSLNKRQRGFVVILIGEELNDL